MTQPAPRRPRPVAGIPARAGGLVAGKSYAPAAPRLAGHGPRRWPNRDYSDVEPRPLREAYVWWQQIRKDVPLRRRTRGWEQQHLAAAAGIALNTVQRIERGEWVAAHNRFQVCSALDLQVAQTVDLDDPAQDAGRRGDRSMPSTVATSIATPRVTDGSPFSTARIGQPVLRGGWSAPSDGM